MEQEKTLKRWWDFPAAILLLAAILTAATRLVSTNWTENLDIIQTLAFFGVIAGFALGKSLFSPSTILVLSAAYGAFAIPWQLGLTLEKNLLWLERMQILIERLVIILQQLVNREPVQDSLLFIAIMSVIFWTLSIHAGFNLVRNGSAWGSILPTGLTMFTIHHFDALVTRRSWYLAIYIFFSLVMAARMVYVQRQEHWQKTRTALPPHLGLDFIRFAMIGAVLIILFSWTVPALANSLPAAQRIWQPVARVWEETRDRFDNAFASLRSSVGVVSQYYGVSTTLGRGTPLTDTPIFTARLPDTLPDDIRLYFRARSYDTYETGQWFSTFNTVYKYNPETDELPIPVEAARWEGTFNIISAIHLSTLYTPSQPVKTNQAGQVEYALNPDGTLDLATFRAIPAVNPGEVYQAQASINYATESQLKAAGTDYPIWITERYLALPESMTLRTRQLAIDITNQFETPYEKAAAITDYLRKNIEYVENIEADFPENQDLIDWFLFDYQKGFCNYYATAEVLLLRAIGIPARWAVGYAEGERIGVENKAGRGNRSSGGSTIVRQKDAHAWPEVYFPGFGWIEFEPTASQPDILRLPGNTDPGLGNASLSDTQDLESLLREMEEDMALLRQQQQDSAAANSPMAKSSSWFYWLAALLTTGIVGYTAWRYRRRFGRWFKFQPFPILIENTFLRVGLQPPLLIRRWAAQAALPSLFKYYQEINKALSRLGKQPTETQTPAERAEALSELIPEMEKPTQALLHEYEREIFGKQHANLIVALRSAGDIRRASTRAFLNGLLQRIPIASKLLQKSKHDVKSQV